MARLIISEEVRELLPTALLERVLAYREHTEIVCANCGGTVPPEDPTPVTVVVRFDRANDRPVVQYAHATCSPSTIDATPVASLRERRMTYLPFLRRHKIASVLVWEPTGLSFDADRGDVITVAAYREFGFQGSEAGMAATVGPILSGWVLRSRGRNLGLDSPHGALEQFDDITFTAPPGWLDAARTSRRCLLITGEGLGLERPSPERIDALLADGRAVAAVVLAKLAAR